MISENAPRQAFARFETDRARRYLSALCHHFGRKVEVRCSPNQGWVRFPFGECVMEADDQRLALAVTANEPTHLDQVIQIITSHLERFAFRENPLLVWKLKTIEPKEKETTT